MDHTKSASLNVAQKEKAESSCIGFVSSVLPEAKSPVSGECSKTGVSTNSAVLRTGLLASPHRWYALRTTYGREKKAYEYIVEHNGIAFCPLMTTHKTVRGKKKLVEVSRIPNIFFAYGTKEEIEEFVYDNVNLSYLRFYYKHTHVGNKIDKTPMIVPDGQIESLKKICNCSSNQEVLVFPNEVKKFQTGQRVRVTDGYFEGVEGVVARFQGQQRVGIVINGLLTAITAYIPSAFLEKTDEES